MSTRTITDGDHAVLYDSTAGIAFGPVFEGLDAPDQAAHFVWWVETQEYDPPLEGRCDIRQFTPKQITEMHTEWAEKFTDQENGELTADAHRQLMSVT